jgi:RNA polymerase sigma-70 factor (ECF subfamily)
MDFLEIYDQHYDRVRRFVVHMVKDEWVADDLIQEIFLRVRTKMETVRDPAKISAWVFGIASNLCQDHFRSLKRTSPSERDCSQGSELLVHFPAQKALEQHEMGGCVQNYLSLLPESLRIVLIHSDIMEHTPKEIAEMLDISVENVRVRLHRARTKLKEILGRNCAFEKDERDVLVCVPRRAAHRCFFGRSFRSCRPF